MSLSSVTISGTLRKDPEKRFTPTNIPVTNLIIEVCYLPRGGQQGQPNISSQTIRVNAWRDLANECEQKLKSGDKVVVMGRAQINAYTNNEGKKKKEIEIDANSVISLKEILALQPVSKEQNDEPSNSFKKSPNTSEQFSGAEEMITNTEEIPF